MLAVIGGCAAVASSQWTVTNLHPPGASNSLAWGVGDGPTPGSVQQVGEVVFPTTANTRAALWAGSATSFVDISPITGTVGTSRAHAVTQGVQVGGGLVNNVAHASRWQRTGVSWSSLNPTPPPPTVIAGDAFGAENGAAVGYFTTADLVTRAAVWQPVAGTPVIAVAELHPPTAISSIALGTSGGEHVGQANFGAGQRAQLWTIVNNVVQRVELHPTAAANSYASDTDGLQQVGRASVAGLTTRASLWTGTASSWVDLGPAGATNCDATGVRDGRQVGVVTPQGQTRSRASIWAGVPESWGDLHQYLSGTTFVASGAQGIWSDGTTVYIVGWGWTGPAGRFEALMWSAPLGSNVCDTIDFHRDGVFPDAQDYVTF
jgi:hypothetical protein